jgi:hypothetical protein
MAMDVPPRAVAAGAEVVVVAARIPEDRSNLSASTTVGRPEL